MAIAGGGSIDIGAWSLVVALGSAPVACDLDLDFVSEGAECEGL